jgi:hypothetical protein
MADPIEARARHVFRLNTCTSLFRKLQREKERIQMSQGSHVEHMADHCMNFFVTAWHLFDWVCELHGDRVRHLGKTRFELRMWAFEQCESLRYCDIMCNAWKHGGVADDKNWRPKIEVSGYDPAMFDDTDKGDVEAIATRLQKARKWPVILVDGKKLQIISICSEVEGFWSSFLKEQKIYEAEGIHYLRGA